jgi:hypothetical protein
LTKEREKEMFNLAMQISFGEDPEINFKSELNSNSDFAYFHGFKGEAGYIEPLTKDCLKYYKSKQK